MVDIKNKIILLLPSKTGSNSIRKCFNESGFDFIEPKNKSNYPTYHSTISEIIHLFDIKKEELKNFKILHFIRHPYNRFISSWIHQSEIMGWYSLKLDDIISMVEKHKHLVRYNTDEFYKNFYGDTSYKDRFFKNNNWGGLRFWWEQNWWNDLEIPTKIFKLEDIMDSTESISEYLGCDLKNLPNLRPNIMRKNINDYSIYKEVYGDRVYELYKNDYILFDYEF